MPLPIDRFPYTRKPYTNIVPLTYRDAATMIQSVEDIKTYLFTVLVPETNANFLLLQEQWDLNVAELTQQVDEAIALGNQQVADALAANALAVAEELADNQVAIAAQLAAQDQAVADQLAAQDQAIAAEIATVQSVAFSDPVMNALVSDEDSLTRGTLDTLYEAAGAGVSDAAVNAILENPASESRATLNDEYIQESELDPDSTVIIKTANSQSRIALDGLYGLHEEDTGWVTIEPSQFRAGWSGAQVGIQGRRIGKQGYINVNVSALADTFNVDINGATSGGNIICDGINLEFSPDFPDNGGTSAYQISIQSNGYGLRLSQHGQLRVLTAPIAATQAGTVPNVATSIVGWGAYPVGGWDFVEDFEEGLNGWATLNAATTVFLDPDFMSQGQNCMGVQRIPGGATAVAVMAGKTYNGLIPGARYKYRAWVGDYDGFNSVGNALTDWSIGVTGVGVSGPVNPSADPNLKAFPEMEFTATAASHQLFVSYISDSAGDSSSTRATYWDNITLDRIG